MTHLSGKPPLPIQGILDTVMETQINLIDYVNFKKNLLFWTQLIILWIFDFFYILHYTIAEIFNFFLQISGSTFW